LRHDDRPGQGFGIRKDDAHRLELRLTRRAVHRDGQSRSEGSHQRAHRREIHEYQFALVRAYRDQGEQDFLWNSWRNSLGSGEGLWIGLERSHHGTIFVWMNGEPVNFTFWATNLYGPEPNNGWGRYEEDYVNMDSRFTPAGAWNDVPNEGADWLTDRGIVELDNPGNPGGGEVSTPEVSTLVLLGSGLAGLVLRRRRRARAASNGDTAVEAPQESNSTPVA